MGNRNNENLCTMTEIDNVVAERPQPELLDPSRQRKSDFRVLGDENEGGLYFCRETVAEMLALNVEVFDSFSYLGLSGFEKANRFQPLRVRSRAKTSSAGTALIFPALKSAYRRSASAAHKASFSSSEMSSRLSSS